MLIAALFIIARTSFIVESSLAIMFVVVVVVVVVVVNPVEFENWSF